MDTVPQTSQQVTPSFQQAHQVTYRGASRRSIQNSMNDLSLRVLKRLEIPDRTARLVLSIQAAIGNSNPGEVCQRSRFAIAQGLKLKGDRAQQKDRVSKLLGMLNTQQSKCGSILIECFPGNPTQAPAFLDHLGPLVEEADNKRRSDPRWKGEKQDKWAATDTVVDWILEKLPPAEPEADHETAHLSANEFIRRSTEEIKRAADRKAEKIETEYRSTLAASNFLRQLSRDFWRMADSLEKTAIARPHPETDSTGNSGSRELTFSETQAESEAVEERGGIPQNDYPPADNSIDCNTDLPPCAQPEFDEEKAKDAFFAELPTDQERLDAALHYASLGRRIVPVYGLTLERHCQCKGGHECKSAGKHPRIINWQNEATTDADQIRKWWSKWPSSNIGWAMGGPEGFLTLDFDGEEGEARYQELQNKGLIPPTLEQKTGSGGRQAIFRGAPDLKNEVKLAPGLDIRSQGGQVVVPPSVSGKGPYSWRNDLTEPAILPRELLEWIQDKINDRTAEELLKRTAHTSATNGYILGSCSLPAVIPEGERNNRLYSYLCGRARSLQTINELQSAAEKANAAAHLDTVELEKIVKSASKYLGEELRERGVVARV